MALKADRHEETTDISFFYNTGTATRGGVVIYDTSQNTASGAAMDQGANLVKYKACADTDIPVGILMNDVVNKDLTRTHLNEHKDEVQQGGKVTILTKGWVVTNNVTGTPTPGLMAYADTVTAGNITATVPGLGPGSGNRAVGRWMSYKDSDGYAKLSVNLPNHGGN
jgi:hypothetical protein